MKKFCLPLALAAILTTSSAFGDLVYHSLSSGDFSQDWSNAGLITANDDWSGVPSIEGYRGDDLTAVTGVDPQTIIAFSGLPAGAVIDVNANQTAPNTFSTGGVAEFAITDPTVALQGSGTADAPFLIFYMNSTGRSNITISYNLRDIDGSTDNSVQQVALQYRIGTSGNFINVPGAFAADASTGPSSATQVTAVSSSLLAWDNVGQLQFRVITANAVGNDEWIGVDDIRVTSVAAIPEPSAFALSAILGGAVLFRRRK